MQKFAAVNFSLNEANALLSRAFENVGVPDAVAASVAHALVTAEAEGQVGHGFARVADYAAQAKSGTINCAAKIKVDRKAPAALFVDADLGFAYPAIEAGLEQGLPLAKEMGIALIAIGNSHHCGALSMHVDRIAQAGLIGLMVANTPKAIAPWGAKEPYFGTNPIAFATPVADGPPLVIDLSLSVVARGKVMAAKKSGKSIPKGWALDQDGRPTTDPEAALGGTMVPIGEAKGTALALMVEVLAAGLTGSAFGSEAGSYFQAKGDPPRVGQTIVLINPDGQSGYAGRVQELLDGMTAMDGARLPGQRRRAALRQAKDHGINVPEPLVATVRELADSSG